MTLNCCGVMPIKAKIASETSSEKEENLEWWGDERPREPPDAGGIANLSAAREDARPTRPTLFCHSNHVERDRFIRNADSSDLGFGSCWWTKRIEKLRADVVEFVA